MLANQGLDAAAPPTCSACDSLCALSSLFSIIIPFSTQSSIFRPACCGSSSAYSYDIMHTPGVYSYVPGYETATAAAAALVTLEEVLTFALDRGSRVLAKQGLGAAVPPTTSA